MRRNKQIKPNIEIMTRSKKLRLRTKEKERLRTKEKLRLRTKEKERKKNIKSFRDYSYCSSPQQKKIAI